MPGRGRMPAVEPILMMTPPPALRNTGTTAWQPRNTPLTLTAKVRSNSSSSISSIGLLTCVVPALLTRMSSAAERRQRFLDRAAKSAFLRHVAAQRDGVVADGARRCFRRINIDIDERDAGALARISLGDAFADAGSGAGDQSGLAFETHVSAPFRHDAVARRVGKIVCSAATAWASRVHDFAHAVAHCRRDAHPTSARRHNFSPSRARPRCACAACIRSRSSRS